jgi:glycosyltransferase involved in cell wall biosynthesis
MRLLYVTHQYPPAIGGSEKYVGDLSQEMSSRGHQVEVFTSRSLDYRTWTSELGPHERVGGVTVRRFRSLRRTPLAWHVLRWAQRAYWRTRSRFYRPFLHLGGGPLCPGMFAALVRRVGNYDLVHLNGLVYSHSAYAYRVAHWRHVPCVVTPHIEIGQEVTYGYDYQLDILKGCAHVVSDTEGERRLVLSLGVSPWRVTTAGCGVHERDYPIRDPAACRQKLGLPRKGFVILFMGRQVQYKGIEPTLHAAALLRKRHPSVHLLLAGPETEYSRRLLARWQGHPWITNLGRVSDDTRLDALNACDCMALPSSGEAFGIVYLEAWVTGKPVVGADTPAVSTVIRDGADGWLVPAGDSFAVAQAIGRWVKSPELVRQMGESGRSKVLRQFTVARVADVVEGVYARTLRTRGQVEGQGDRARSDDL